MNTITDKIIEVARDKGIIRPRDIQGVDDATPYLGDLVGRGLLNKVGRGLYTLADREPSASFSLVQATARVRGIVCLLSASRPRSVMRYGSRLAPRSPDALPLGQVDPGVLRFRFLETVRLAMVEVVHAEGAGFSPAFNLKDYRLLGRARSDEPWRVLSTVRHDKPSARDRLVLEGSGAWCINWEAAILQGWRCRETAGSGGDGELRGDHATVYLVHSDEGLREAVVAGGADGPDEVDGAGESGVDDQELVDQLRGIEPCMSRWRE